MKVCDKCGSSDKVERFKVGKLCGGGHRISNDLCSNHKWELYRIIRKYIKEK